ncbi:MAG: hypothetical protein CMO44_17075 [Verrucomicrobiales bacterium]|nr:hypothetical protein [Verrucomicrobiales bacterium]
MSSLVVGPAPPKQKEEKALLKKGDVPEYKNPELVEFETEVLYERIEELETELQQYKYMIERIKHAILGEGKGDVRVIIQNILKQQNLKRNIEVVD